MIQRKINRSINIFLIILFLSSCTLNRYEKVDAAVSFCKKNNLGEDFVNLVIENNKKNNLIAIEVLNGDLLRILYKDNSDVRKYYKCDLSSYERDSILNELGVLDIVTVTLNKGLSHVYVDNDLVEVFVNKIGILLNVTESRKNIDTDYGAFHINTLLENFEKNEKEWAKRINSTWYLVEFKSNN